MGTSALTDIVNKLNESASNSSDADYLLLVAEENLRECAERLEYIVRLLSKYRKEAT